MSSDAYLQHAATAEAWARQASNDRERDAYLEIAALWRGLADRRATAAAAFPPPPQGRRAAPDGRPA
jgi:hypothetical protein